jgi:glycosyltransferase involved in cell wall biosynthesis
MMKKILFLSRWYPSPPDNGSKLRIYNLLHGLSGQYDVTLLSFSDFTGMSPDAGEIQSLCSEAHIIPWNEFNPDSLRARFGFLSLTPRSLVDTFSPEMSRKISQLLSLHDYDLVIASQLSMARYRPYFNDVPALFDEVEIGLIHGNSHRVFGIMKRIRHTMAWFKFRKYLSRLLKSYQAFTVVSEKELELVASQFSTHAKKVSVIPNSIQFDDYQELNAQPVPAQLIFTGSFRFHANYEAMKWFLGRVFPKIRNLRPDVQLVITGDHAGLPLPSVENVTLAGYVDDIKSLIASSQISIVPLLSGGGTRLKILEAMAIGTPVVATSKGAEGLGAEDGEQILLADSPGDFADRVLKLLGDADLHEKLSVNGKLFVKENYDWKAVVPRFLLMLERIGNNDSEA